MISNKVKNCHIETGRSQIYHCLYCYFTCHFSIIPMQFSFSHLLLFLSLTDVNNWSAVADEASPVLRIQNQTTAASEAEYNDEPYN
ncbi:hypothetical protein AERO8C_160284 [Aeromonas veronii]|uniref:Uncharacterized protein n=1 Tax=Aeromonas veronii TaxID=654 RepID=A0A653KZW6_AERVE|nr:hypothetical protein AERO8C_160284 [Aeromonas veronii]